MTPEQTRRVRELNDAFRTHPLGLGGRVVATQGVTAKGLDFLNAAYTAVREFKDFNEDNDPWKAHDGATIIVDDTLLYWKVDVYRDAECEYGAEEPWLPDASYRVLTILLMEEY